MSESVPQKLTESIEDYLETVLILSNQQEKVRSIDVATYLGFSRPSVSHAVKLLQDQGYIEKEKNKYLVLTPAGIEIAEETYRRHQFFQNLLEDLGVPEEIAREDACRIEHIISRESFEALSSFYLEAKKALEKY